MTIKVPNYVLWISATILGFKLLVEGFKHIMFLFSDQIQQPELFGAYVATVIAYVFTVIVPLLLINERIKSKSSFKTP